MAKFEIKMPKLGESITEGTILSWSVKIGDVVNEDDILFDVETAKVSAEIPSPVAGKVIEILFKEGDTIAVGTMVAIIETESDNIVEADNTEPQEKATPAPAATPTPKSEDEKWYSPLVLQLAEEAKIPLEELSMISGTGYLGRLTKKDIKNYIDKKGTVVEKVLDKTNTAQPKNEVEQPSQKIITSLPTTADDIIVEMDTIRRITSERMVASKHTSAHVTTVVEVDVTKLVDWRKRNKDKFIEHEGITLTYMPAIVEATAKALVEFPEINASVDGTHIIRKKQINIGIAVALAGWNLIVPVIRNADKLSISGLAQQIDLLANKARTNKLKLDDIEEGTFTITNFGTFKNIFGTPIINQPEVAILGVGYIEKKPTVMETPEGDVIAIRSKMYLSLSYDHRIIDGALGGAFLKRIADILENWNNSL